jgi:hypothetical protein
MSNPTEKRVELVFCILSSVAAALFLASGVAYLWFGHWPVTHQDFWRIYAVCLNRSWLASAVLKYNGHSHFFPSQIWLADLRFFHGDQELLFIVGFVLLCASVSLIVIPIWCDEAGSNTSKIAAILLLVVGNAWMQRASMTASGGFSCCYSLALGGAALAFWYLPDMRDASPRRSIATLVVACAGILSSFSFGTGLAIWPTLLLLGYCLRLNNRSLAYIAATAIGVVVAFWLLPSREVGSSPIAEAMISSVSGTFRVLCRLIGAPVGYAAAGWYGADVRHAPVETSAIPLLSGIAGLAASVLIVIHAVTRRDIGSSTLRFTGFALMVFNLGALLLIAVGREHHIRLIPSEIAAPRYLFWSTLLWAGMLIVLVSFAQTRPFWRWLVLSLVLAVPVLVFPSHYKEGQHWRFARCLSESAATSLINGVRDDKQVEILFRPPDVVYQLAPQLRIRRLDMFAGALADWIGSRASDVFQRRNKAHYLRGWARVDGFVPCPNGAPAARVRASVTGQGGVTPAIMVIVDAQGTIRGIARSCSTSRLVSRILYLGKFNTRSCLGYICNYDPRQSYSLHAVDDGTLSNEGIPIHPAVPPTAAR